MLPDVIATRYAVKDLIGQGCFGEIYACEHLISHKTYAAKFEPETAKLPTLKKESKAFRALVGSPGIPRVHYFGKAGTYNVMVNDLLGRSLEQVLIDSGGTLPLRSVLILADQLLETFEAIHGGLYIHRDVKPENFLLDVDEQRVNVIDFGFARKYLDANHTHIPYQCGLDLIGTARYVSINTHMGIEQSRRDDLESLGYVLVYLLKGRLPWQGSDASTLKEQHDYISRIKIQLSYEALCEDLPQEFAGYFKVVRSLDFEQDPPYKQLRSLFQQVFQRNRFTLDGGFDFLGEYRPPQPTSIPRAIPIQTPVFHGIERVSAAKLTAVSNHRSPQRKSGYILLPRVRSASLTLHQHPRTFSAIVKNRFIDYGD